MTEIPETEPVRWLEDSAADPSLRADLAHGAGAVAVGVDYAATLGALRAAMATTGPVATTAGAAATGSTMALKVGIAAVALAGAAAWWMSTRPPDDRGNASVAAASASDAAPEQDSELGTRALPSPAAKPSRVEDSANPSISSGAGSSGVASGSGAVPTPSVVPSDAVAEPAIPGPAVDDATEADRPEADRVEADRVEPAERRVKRPTEADSDQDFLREAKLVSTARKQLADDPTAALASTRRHAREFPRGALVEESDAIEVRALAQLGKSDEAQRKAAEFLGRYSDGPHAAAVRRAIEQP